MGGWGSGRKNYQLKALVEDSLKLPIKLVYESLRIVDIERNSKAYGSVRWTISGKQIGNLRYKTYMKNNLLFASLMYQKPHDTDPLDLDYPIRIVHTTPNFGGRRYWFSCPIIVNGKPCFRRSGTLYLPPGGIYFGCRECHDLVYLSSRESHRWDNMWRKMGYEPSIQKLLEKGEW